MDQAIFEQLQQTLAAKGPAAAIEQLCTDLREQKDYTGLFYALLMKRRHELGVSPIPTAPAQELPVEAHAPYEDAIREAARTVGDLHLRAGEIPQAWVYFRMIGEPEPVRAALEAHEPREDEDLQTLVQIAFYEGVHPRKGFDWILTRYGICNSITTLSSQMDLPHAPDVRPYCVQRLVRALYDELRERLRADIERREEPPAAGARVRDLLAGRDWLFADEFAHIDTSHLSSVVQMSTQLEPGAELDMARELCTYGQRLSGRLRYPGDPPFEDTYRDYGVYLSILAGDGVEEGLAHFRTKAEQADPETIGTYPAEVLVNLLLRLDRPAEALTVARRFLAGVTDRRLTCPGVGELCQKVKDYRTLAEVAREQGDPVHFVAGLIAERR
ncbi:MAG TPA: hypothetical protein VJ739_17990 [Gemmataceae bacterium]|nr:hypothetical protein [Gemmataceae bacterium]